MTALEAFDRIALYLLRTRPEDRPQVVADIDIVRAALRAGGAVE